MMNLSSLFELFILTAAIVYNGVFLDFLKADTKQLYLIQRTVYF